MRAKQALEYLGLNKLSYNTLYRMVDDGLPAIKVGKVHWFKKSDIDKFMQEHQTSAGKEKEGV